MNYPPGSNTKDAPWNDKTPDPDFKLISVQWCSEKGELWVECEIYHQPIFFAIWCDDKEFEQLLPSDPPEYKHKDEIYDYMAVMLDDFFNLHWLVKDYKGQVHHSIVDLTKVLPGIAIEKYQNQFR